VIVARAFAPPSPTWKYATLPFDPENSEHATHVAGIAAGDNGTRATGYPGSPILSGVAPAAYIGNYKALTIPTPGVGLDGNAPEIAKAIEQAVADGMDVINLSIGEPEIEPSRDVVVQALNGAAAAGVVPVVAAGNDFDEFGRGSVGSPGDASGAITVAASTGGHGSPTPDIIAGFSSSGPTPYSLQLKPDVTAPGVAILSSVPARVGTWDQFNGTSMATPHVAGAAALLRQRHPAWTVPQIKSALAQTGAPVYGSAAKSAELSPLREGGGRIDLTRANNPLLFASPSNVSFGMLRPGASVDQVVTLSDAGGGAGVWNVTLSGNGITTPATATVPGPLAVHASIPAGTADGDSAGFIVLTRGSDVRRIPFWLHVESPKLGPPSKTLTKAGTYAGDTRKGRSSVDSYRFPEPPVPALAGPEQVFAYKVTRTVANIGARVVSQRGAAKITPRLVRDRDENRLTGYTGLPGDLNPYRDSFGSATPVVAAILPGRGTYDVVFDSVSSATAGRFTFRFWINDVSPPTVKLRGYSKGFVTLTVTDAGSGVDPHSMSASVDGVKHNVTFNGGVASIASGTLVRGNHNVSLIVSDYQESKNMEDVARILPNTRFFSGTLKLR
jgi:hypothetical protein